MPTIFDVPTNELIELVAKELRESGATKAPAWAAFAKTGCHKERPPSRPDWWEIRAAAILRKICTKGPIGVSKLRSQYGGKRNIGSAPERTFKGSGAVIRKILQQLDKAGLTRHTKIGVHSGRIVTPKGKSMLDKAANQLAKQLNIRVKTAPSEEPIDTEQPAPEAQPEQAGEKKQPKKKPAQE